MVRGGALRIEPHERLIRHVGQPLRRLVMSSLRCGHGQDKAVAQQRNTGQMRCLITAPGHDAAVDLLARNGGSLLCRKHRRHRNLDLRARGAKCLQHVRHNGCAEIVRQHTQVQFTELTCSATQGAIAPGLQISQQLPGVTQKTLAGGGQLHAPRLARQQRRANGGFQLKDLPRQGGLDDADGPRARHHAASLRDRNEVAKVA